MLRKHKSPITFPARVKFILFLTLAGFIFELFSGLIAVADTSNTVRVGAYVNQIRDVELKSQSFSADIYLWFKWKNPDLNPDKTFEIMNAFDPNSSVMSKTYSERTELSSGDFYQVIRYQGRFSSDISLRNYPFDRQRIEIVLEDSTFTTADLVYISDREPITTNSELSLPGYQISYPTLSITEQLYPTDFGYPIDGPRDKYSRITISTEISRPVLPYVLKLIFPIILIVLVAALAFWITPKEVEARVGMVVTALLTLVALQITTNSNLPEVEYLMLIDLLYNISFAFVLSVMVDVVLTTSLYHSGRENTALKIGNIYRLIVILIYVAIITVILYLFR